VLCAAIACFLTLGASRASADSFSITDSNLGSGFNGPFATVTITLVNSTTANVTFQANDSGVSGGAAGYQLIDGNAADMNINGSFSVSNLADTQLATFHTNSPSAWTQGSGNVDGFGAFNLNINTQDGAGSAMDTISFTLTDTSGTWSSAANVLSPNSQGNDLAVHIATCGGTPCTLSNTGATTGFGSQGPSTTTPEAASMVLMGTFLLGAATLLGRKLRAFES
jgi:hypothetical protein